eukprot:gnl/Dysnectes_brevis/6925_a11157_224.p1 GENE.gnl/Dysnectes_brevis/6925_a11157_224~~gnl/Dysnectes_brevis/6925_a11157_224.p1  ORF type:complete len:1027 (-),score=323.56 gnl/Dysnectes_brevis/6925_a11157_224:101-3181(-)
MKQTKALPASKGAFKGTASNFIVAVRCRPENREERSGPYRNVIKVCNQNMLVFDPKPQTGNIRRGPGSHRHRDVRFAFDRVFREEATNAEVYEQTAKRLLDPVLKGFNGSMFAYGATGAGKTHSMVGNDTSGGGIMTHTMRELFERIAEDHQHRYHVAVTYLEIYNENIRDLLSKTPAKNLPLREDPERGPTIRGLREEFPTCIEDVQRLLERGARSRTQFATAANEQSSRSHAIFQIRVETRPKVSSTSDSVLVGKLSLIDLAGSERAARTKNKGIRLREGANINRSLLALGNCINALCRAKGKRVYVPYRNSKLTRLLKDSLGGNCMTVMLSAISQSSYSFEDTLNTLNYANRAKNIRTQLKKNVRSVKYHVSEYNRIILELRSEVADLKDTLKQTVANAARQASASGPSSDPELQSKYDGIISQKKKAQELRDELMERLRRHNALSQRAYDLQLEIKSLQRQYEREKRTKTLHETISGVPTSDPGTPVGVRAACKRMVELRQRAVGLRREEESVLAEYKPLSSEIRRLRDEGISQLQDPDHQAWLQELVRYHGAKSELNATSSLCKHHETIRKEQAKELQSQRESITAMVGITTEIYKLARQSNPGKVDELFRSFGKHVGNACGVEAATPVLKRVNHTGGSFSSSFRMTTPIGLTTPVLNSRRAEAAGMAASGHELPKRLDQQATSSLAHTSGAVAPSSEQEESPAVDLTGSQLSSSALLEDKASEQARPAAAVTIERTQKRSLVPSTSSTAPLTSADLAAPKPAQVHQPTRISQRPKPAPMEASVGVSVPRSVSARTATPAGTDNARSVSAPRSSAMFTRVQAPKEDAHSRGVRNNQSHARSSTVKAKGVTKARSRPSRPPARPISAADLARREALERYKREKYTGKDTPSSRPSTAPTSRAVLGVRQPTSETDGPIRPVLRKMTSTPRDSGGKAKPRRRYKVVSSRVDSRRTASASARQIANEANSKSVSFAPGTKGTKLAGAGSDYASQLAELESGLSSVSVRNTRSQSARLMSILKRRK